MSRFPSFLATVATVLCFSHHTFVEGFYDGTTNASTCNCQPNDRGAYSHEIAHTPDSQYQHPDWSVNQKTHHDVIQHISTDKEIRLTKALARPVEFSNDTVWLGYGIIPMEVTSFDGKKQIIEINQVEINFWMQTGMWWNMSNYNSTNYAEVEIILFPGDIWTPDVILLNAVEIKRANLDWNYQVGLMNLDYAWTQWVLMLKAPCPVDMHNFPFDEQQCLFRYGSWGYDEKELNLDSYFSPNPPVYMGLLIQNKQWQLSDHSSGFSKEVRDGRTYTIINSYLTLRRTSGFYVTMVLIPTILLATLILTIFWIPPSRPDRTGLGMSVFAGLMLLLLMVVQVSPPSTDVKIGTYYCINIVLVVMATVLSASVVAISNKNKPMAQWLRNSMVLGVGKVLGIMQQYNTVYPADDPKDRNQTTIRDWQTLAVVLDRLLFISYLIIVAIGIGLFFPFPTASKYVA